MTALEDVGEAIATLAAEITVANHRLLTLIREFDRAEAWFAQGALSCAHWLSWRIGLDLGAAREKVRVARALGDLPVIDEAFARAQLSYSKVRALTRVATAANEGELVELACRATASQTEKLCRKYRAVLAADAPATMTREICDRFVSQRATDDGLVRVTVQMLPEEAAILMKAIEAARDRTSRDRARRTSVDGLVEIAEAFLAGGDVSAETSRRAPVEVVLHVERDGVAHLDDGAPVAMTTARRLACDAATVRVTEGPDGEVLSVGRRTRTIPASIRRALRARDGGCRFPGCTHRRYVDGHHIRHWADGGETKLSNLVELCRRHHRYLHEYGFGIEVVDGEIGFTDQRGQAVSLAPDLPRPGGRGLPAVEAQMPIWDGAPLDYGWAVEGLLASGTGAA